VEYIDEKDKIEGQSARTSERKGNNQVQVSGDRSERSHITGRFPANLILSYPENEYMLKDNLTKEQKEKVMRWLNENS
jgi:hypothetical protein